MASVLWLSLFVVCVARIVGQQEDDVQMNLPREPVTEDDIESMFDGFDDGQINEIKVRQFFPDLCEVRLNEQIGYEFTASQVYLSMSMYLSRWDVALPGFASMFRRMSDEERDHGIQIMNYINKRGGIVKMPLTINVTEYRTQIESNHWGDVMNVLMTALKMERLVNHRLVDFVRSCANTQNYHMEDFVDGVFLTEQVDSIHQLGKMITEVKMIGSSHLDNFGLYEYDKRLQK